MYINMLVSLLLCHVESRSLQRRHVSVTTLFGLQTYKFWALYNSNFSSPVTHKVHF